MNEPVSPVHIALGALLVALAVTAIFARTRNASALVGLESPMPMPSSPIGMPVSPDMS